MNNQSHLSLDIILRRGKHPFITGSYINGYSKAIPLQNKNEKEVFNTVNKLFSSGKLKIEN
jgi:hypothetical protein